MKRISSLGVSEGAYIAVEHEWYDGKTILVSMQSNGLGNPEYSVELDAKKIRKLRKQLKRALAEIEAESGVKDDAWIPKPGDRVKFVDEATLDFMDKRTWHPKVGEIYVVSHVYDGGMYKGFSLMETPDEKYTLLSHGYKFRASGFEPVA